jgi:hypothetical protein
MLDYVRREFNQAAHVMARLAISKEMDRLWFHSSLNVLLRSLYQSKRLRPTFQRVIQFVVIMLYEVVYKMKVTNLNFFSHFLV